MNPDAKLQPPFAAYMGMKITHVSKSRSGKYLNRVNRM